MGSRQPRVHTCPEYTLTLGPEAVELAQTTGLFMDPWQADIMDDMLAVHPGTGGQWVCRECGIVVSRQNGKGSIFECRALAGLFLLNEKKIMWSAHQHKTVLEGFKRIRALIETNPDLEKRIYSVNLSHGKEGITLSGPNGKLITGRQELQFLARSKASGRGFSGDCNLWDEVFALTDVQVDAMMPTVSAMPNPQIIYASTPPLDANSGEPMFALRDRGEMINGNVEQDPELSWWDWGQLATADQRDPRVWAASNPALGIRITFATVARELRVMPKGFGRERLSIWPSRSIDRLIPQPWWTACHDADSTMDDDVMIAIDVEPDQATGCMVVYGVRPDGLGHVEVIEYDSGVDWIVAAADEINKASKPYGWIIDEAGPAGALIPELDKIGIKRFTKTIDPKKRETWPMRGSLFVPSVREYAGMCARFYNAIKDHELRHIEQDVLSTAIEGAATVPLGDAWKWARRKAEENISPLVGGTLARGAHEKYAHLVIERKNAWDAIR